MHNIFITGGAGFIGSNFIRYVIEKTDFSGKVINLDKLTYAGNLLNLKDIEERFGGKRYFFERGDICDYKRVNDLFRRYDVDVIVNFAAESHVDRSIVGPKAFIKTNVMGTFNLLEVARHFWNHRKDVRFHHISTDEVYGSLKETGYFYETTAYDPRSPYSASKAASDHLLNAYYHTYGIPITISNCSNNYGPYQFPEKLIPLLILNAIEGKPLPIYGDGKNIRDWLYIDDHCEAIWLILNSDKTGETYNIGSECEKENIEVTKDICDRLEEIYPIKNNSLINDSSIKHYKDLINFVADRPGHDRRYAINCDKIKNELGWIQKYNFKDALILTIKWYLENMDWVNKVKSGDYIKWFERNYKLRKEAV